MKTLYIVLFIFSFLKTTKAGDVMIPIGQKQGVITGKNLFHAKPYGIFPVQFLSFTGVHQNKNVLLKGVVIADKDLDHFEIERSTDNITYVKAVTITQPALLNEQQNFSVVDDIGSLSSEIIYYKLKVIGKTGEFKYSNILVVRLGSTGTRVSITPNPSKDYVSISFFAEKESEIIIRLINNFGKTVLLQNKKVSKGSNTMHLPGLAKYGNGVYSLQLFVNGEQVTQKLVLLK